MYEIGLSSSEVLTDYQVKLQLPYFDYPFELDFSNLRFWWEGIIIPHWVEDPDNGIVWVKVPIIDGNTKIYLEAGPNVGRGDGDATFDFFDDFEGTSLDTNKWSVDSGITYSVTDSKLVVTGTANDTAGSIYGLRCVAPITFPDSFVLEAFDVYWNDGGSNSAVYRWGIVLTDGTAKVVGVVVNDAWAGYSGGRSVWVNNTETLLTGLNTLPHSGTTNFIITKKADNSVNIVWDETHSYSSTLSMSFDQLVIQSTKWSSSYPYAVETSLDLIRLRKYADLEPTVTYIRRYVPNSYPLLHILAATSGIIKTFGAFTRINVQDTATTKGIAVVKSEPTTSYYWPAKTAAHHTKTTSSALAAVRSTSTAKITTSVVKTTVHTIANVTATVADVYTKAVIPETTIVKRSVNLSEGSAVIDVGTIISGVPKLVEITVTNDLGYDVTNVRVAAFDDETFSSAVKPVLGGDGTNPGVYESCVRGGATILTADDITAQDVVVASDLATGKSAKFYLRIHVPADQAINDASFVIRLSYDIT